MHTGTIIINEINDKGTYIYCRISNHDRKEQLKTQVKRCEEFCIANGWIIQKTFKEIASGMNDKRPQLIKLLKLKPKRIIVENKDRLTIFGFNYIKELLDETEIVIINNNHEDKKI
jgi:predicted site-specific integrase-resolvase